MASRSSCDTKLQSSSGVGSLLRAKVSPAHCNQLFSSGYTIVDELFGESWSRQLREELEWLHRNGRMLPNKVQFQTTTGPVQLTKPNIFEVDLHDAAVRSLEKLEAYRLLYETNEFVDFFNEQNPDLKLMSGSQGKTVKLQYNCGSGGCFPWHYDNPSRPNKRRLTVLVYLNPSWKEGDGGELQLLPFLGEKVTIEPKMDRTVIFQSDRILHRVLPAWRRRMCFTVWLDSSVVNEDDDIFLKTKHLNVSAVPMLKLSPLQRTLSRAVYTREYEESLRQCFTEGSDGGKACRLALAMHNAHLTSLLKKDSVASFVKELQALKPLC